MFEYTDSALVCIERGLLDPYTLVSEGDQEVFACQRKLSVSSRHLKSTLYLQRAAGEQTLQQQRLAEEKRIQQSDVSGKQFVVVADCPGLVSQK